MATINLISALRLLRQFGDSPEVVNVIQATLDELERYELVKALMADIVRANKAGLIDTGAVEEVEKLLKA